MAWTEQMVEDLKSMWKEGLTTGEIGKRLNVSKNSIVGKVHRLGLSGRPSPIKKKSDAPAPKEPAAPKIKEPAKPVEKPIAKEEKSEPVRPKTETAPAVSGTFAAPRHKGNVSLTELDNHTCRWPIGDPKDENFHFCGKKVRIGQTYCEEHAAVAYVKPGKK